MTDPEDQDLPELELEAVEETAETPAAPEAGSEPLPEATAEAAEAVAAAVAEPAPGAEEAAPDASQGQWVWQYAAPPPPPSFGAMFFSGQALPELYRFFACGLLVVIGCLLPWGPVTTETLDDDGATVEELMALPDVAGVETLLGAVSLVIGLWLVLSSCYGIYTRRQKILPVFLMLEPAFVSWMRLLDGLDKAGEGADLLATLDAVGTGVVLTLVGSTLVSLQFLFVVGKVYTKKDDKGGASSGRRAAKGGKDKKDKDAKGKQDKKDKGGDKDAPDGDKGGKGRGRKKR